MPKYTIVIDTDTDPDREMGLQYVAEQAASRTGVVLTSAEYLKYVLDIAVDSYAKQFLNSEFGALVPKYEKADTAQRAVVKNVLAAVQPPPEEVAAEVTP